MARHWEDTFWAAFRVFLSFGPIWLALFLTLTIYANEYKFCWSFLMAPQDTGIGFIDPPDPSNWYIGLSLIIVSAILKVNWVIPWLQIVVTSWVCDRHWKPPNNSSKRIMQAGSNFWDLSMPSGRLPYRQGLRPRTCPYGCLFEPSDRAYHCSMMNRCLPVYDHYCKYLQATVYLRTMKPYFFVLLFLPLDAVYSFAVSLAALCHPSTRWAAPFVGSIVLCSIAVFLEVEANSFANFNRIVRYNVLAPERTGRRWVIAYKYEDQSGWCLQLRRYDRNPWDLGSRENFLQIFGQRWWKWPFFWWTSEQVSRYGNYVDEDLPFAPFIVREFSDLMASELIRVIIDEEAPSSIHLEELNRRKQTRSNAERRSQAQSDNASVVHVEAFARHQRDARRRTEHSDSHDQNL
ncbi:uncharacterized protein F4822DRAFT_430881 [Hypoxylon trugodes]|uniref:uncharacterized protein n=1 Tax=Hypoxylon trugodes TaxID=326681 RepID=UPI002195D833|nr:uncharacterized protein F4822DRAFT_430881 [Hypoxylon trugodes]KAI1388127.1 hypothetical protein F4822DRAFT_430881 [Hypoxylon trugodes]